MGSVTSFVSDLTGFNQPIDNLFTNEDDKQQYLEQSKQQALQFQNEAIGKASSVLEGGRGGIQAAANQSTGMLQQLMTELDQYFQPYLEVGQQAAGAISKLLADPASIYQNEAYQSFFQQGMKGVENSLIGGGKLYSGQGGKEIFNYGQSTAAKYFGDVLGGYMGVLNTGAASANAAAGFRQNVGGMMASMPWQVQQANMNLNEQLASAYLSTGQARGNIVMASGENQAKAVSGPIDVWNSFIGGQGRMI